jgi:O-antigen/teichoic acid export membrane protein
MTRFAAYISVIGATLTLLINIILIPKYSFLGSAIATFVAYFTMAFLSYVIGKKYYPIPYNTHKILFYLILSVSLSSISFYVYRDNLLIGILCVLIMNLVILLNEKKRIINLLKLMR